MVEIQQSFAIPEYVPEVTGFWGINGRPSDHSSRKKWITDNIPCDGTKRLFACWCAKSALHRFESQNQEDNRPRNAIEVAERFVFFKARVMELRKSESNAGDAANAIVYINFSTSIAAYAATATTYLDAATAAAYAANYAAYDSIATTTDDAARINQSRVLSLFTTPSITVSETTIGLCRAWYESRDTRLIGLISDSLQDSDYPYDYRIEMMEENPECMVIGMWPLTPEIILGADYPHLNV